MQSGDHVSTFTSAGSDPLQDPLKFPPRAVSTPDETSPRPHERILDPTRAATYGHHRQTSIVHGVQHSRNGSLASPSSTPLSPQMTGTTSSGYDRHDMHPVSEGSESETPAVSRPPTAMSGSNVNANSFPLDKSATAALEVSSPPMTQRRHDRMQSRARTQNTSQSSRLHRDEQKTVGEYALHVLFTSVGSCES